MAHDPALEQKRREARARGGRAKSRAARAERLIPEDLQPLDALLNRSAIDVYQGTLAPARASAIAALVSVKLKLRETSLKLREYLVLEERLL